MSQSNHAKHLRAIRAKARLDHAATIERARAIIASSPAFPTPGALNPDNALSQALGHDRVRRAMLGTDREQRAAERRALVLKLVLEGKRPAEIAAATGLAYSTVIGIRIRLRQEGALNR